MADQLYQPGHRASPPPRTGGSRGPGKISKLARRLIRRVTLAVRTRLRSGYPRPYPVTGHEDRDVLWQAKCNALRRALEHHRLTQLDARRVLSLLAAFGERGCELDRLEPLTGLFAEDLERAVLLLGLHNLIEVQKRTSYAHSEFVLWACATGHGRRYASEFAFPVGTTGGDKHPHSLSADHGRSRPGDIKPPAETDGLVYPVLEALRLVSRASVPTLVTTTGLPKATVAACMTVLGRAGLIDVEERPDYRGRLRWATITQRGREELERLYRDGASWQPAHPEKEATR